MVPTVAPPACRVAMENHWVPTPLILLIFSQCFLLVDTALKSAGKEPGKQSPEGRSGTGTRHALDTLVLPPFPFFFFWGTEGVLRHGLSYPGQPLICYVAKDDTDPLVSSQVLALQA